MTTHKQNPKTPHMSDISDNISDKSLHDGAALVDAAAVAWCGQKDRETFPSDIAYFRANWRALPGLRAYVDQALARARSA